VEKVMTFLVLLKDFGNFLQKLNNLNARLIFIKSR